MPSGTHPTATTLEQPIPLSERSGSRVGSIDLVRGLAVIFMALDHIRDYICDIPFSPENINKTYSAYFLVRWVTHFCAPAFFLLAGVGAYLYGRKHSASQVQGFLVTRGIWLVVLEFTVIGYAWSFDPGWAMFGVICCLGSSMVILAAFVRLPRFVIMAAALAVIATHDLFDWLRPAMFPRAPWPLLVLHRFGILHVGSRLVIVLFPIIPWFAVALLGYSLGFLFEGGSEFKQLRSKRILMFAGLGATVLFTLLRFTNAYGNPVAGMTHNSPGDWHLMPTLSKSIILFLDVEKYPPSLQYLLMTLGPILILLSLGGDAFWGAFGRVLRTFGRVPLFYYILHLFLIHLAAIALAAATGQPWRWLLHGGFIMNEPPEGMHYGHGLGVVCAVWITVIFLLYWPCRWFAEVRTDILSRYCASYNLEARKSDPATKREKARREVASFFTASYRKEDSAINTLLNRQAHDLRELGSILIFTPARVNENRPLPFINSASGRMLEA